MSDEFELEDLYAQCGIYCLFLTEE